MNLKEGDRIKIFPDTNKKQYVDLIYKEGFRSRIHHDFIEVGSPLCGNNEQIEFAMAIKNARRSKGMKRSELAKEVGTHNITVFNWETGRSMPSNSNLKKLKQVLGMGV